MLPSATDLRYFLEVSKTLNISRAAERLGISQPTLTQSIRKLESTVGAKLLIRTRTGVHLTQSGQRIFGQVTNLLDSWQSIQSLALQDENELQGSFRVGCHPSVARYALPSFFKELTEIAPKVRIELVHDLSRRITDAVINYRIDLGFVVNPVAHPDLVQKKIGDDIVGVFHSPKERYSELLFGDSDLIQTQNILERLKKTSFSFSHFVPCPNLEVVHRLTSVGAGFGILPSRVANSDSQAGLSLFDPRLPIFRDKIFLTYRKEVMSSRAGKTVVTIAWRVLGSNDYVPL